jgi:hypothetical protein
MTPPTESSSSCPGGAVTGIDGRQLDKVLLPFLLSGQESETERLLADLLVNHALPLVESIVRTSIVQRDRLETTTYQNVETQDLEDIVSEANTRILDKLRRLKEPPNEDAIADFMSYVATVAHNTCCTYWRIRYPNRARLRNRLRFVLTHRPDLAIWKGEDGLWICGFSNWGNSDKLLNAGWLSQARMDPESFINMENVWMVEAAIADRHVRAPAPNKPFATFRVLDELEAKEVGAMRTLWGSSHLVMGLTYAKLGLVREAGKEFRELAAINPESAAAKSLLASVEAGIRGGRPD